MAKWIEIDAKQRKAPEVTQAGSVTIDLEEISSIARWPTGECVIAMKNGEHFSVDVDTAASITDKLTKTRPVKTVGAL